MRLFISQNPPQHLSNTPKNSKATYKRSAKHAQAGSFQYKISVLFSQKKYFGNRKREEEGHNAYVYKTKKQFRLGTLNEQTIELKLLIKFSFERKKKYVSKTVGKINGFFTPHNISPTRFVLIYLD